VEAESRQLSVKHK